jgi:hypothetical protein
VIELGDVEFVREETRRTSVKRWCDCGCVIDSGEPYVYEVWKVCGDESVVDLETCEPCAVNYSGSGGWYRSS